MRTTLDIPDATFKKAKLKAVHEGVAFKVVVIRALERELAAPAPDRAALRKRAQRLFVTLDRAGNEAPVGRLNREDLYDRTVLRRH